MLLKNTWNYITSNKLLLPGESVQVGFSGGSDSVCLLLLLKRLGELHGFSVRAVHVNHRLRGRESEEDQCFAEQFCEERGIPLQCFSYPVEKIAAEKRMGIEEAGRSVRMEAFQISMEQYGIRKTALAHHRNDQAETVLFRLARGSSLAGLSGIRPLQGSIIHPLLFAGKEEILEYLKQEGVSYRMDSSNLTDHYTRNCIRHQIMPVLERKVNAQSLAHIAEAAEDFADTDRFLKELAAPVFDRCVRREQGRIFVSEDLLASDPVLQRLVLHSAVSAACGHRENIGREQLRQLKDLLTGTGGRRYSLPGGTAAVRSGKELILFRKCEDKPDQEYETESVQVQIEVHGSEIYSFGGRRICCELLDEVPSEIPEKTFTKWMDYDRISSCLVFRTRRAGDFLVTAKTGGRKKLKSYLIDEKIPVEERESIPLLASGSEIFWVIGHRISESCKITEQTRRVLKITVSEEDNE
ncbi:MAG: tRNA lysidine(34) synthetase TilS [Lachnospiraceae bacterium]|nr:tRNA lysidine(34) synthetase TilS [Lachnospiraceae bacterium]